MFENDFLPPLETPPSEMPYPDNTATTTESNAQPLVELRPMSPLEGAALTDGSQLREELQQMERQDMPADRETFLIAKGNTPIKGRGRGCYSPRPQPKPVVVVVAKEEAPVPPVDNTLTAVVKRENGSLEGVKQGQKSPLNTNSKKDIPIIKQQTSFKARDK